MGHYNFSLQAKALLASTDLLYDISGSFEFCVLYFPAWEIIIFAKLSPLISTPFQKVLLEHCALSDSGKKVM